MSLHPTFSSLLKAQPSGFFYLQHELSQHIDIEKLEKMMQRIMLKCREITVDDRRQYAPIFTFAEMAVDERNYVRMTMHRPTKDDKPDTVIGHFDFIEVQPLNGKGFPALELAINKWELLSRRIHTDLTAHGAKTVITGLMDYMDPIEYALALSPIKEMLRVPAQSRIGIHFTVEVTNKGINLITMRRDKILMIHQVNVENKEI